MRIKSIFQLAQWLYAEEIRLKNRLAEAHTNEAASLEGSLLTVRKIKGLID